MTIDRAWVWLWVTVALTFAASTSIFLLHVYVRRRFVHWKYWKRSDWLNVLAYVFGVAFWILITIGLSCGLGRDASSTDELDTRKAALTFFLSQVSALISVGTGRLASAVLLSEVLERQSELRLAGFIGYCLCGLWTLAEVALATGGCTYDSTVGRFVCPAEAPRWLAITVVDACLEVCLTTARIILILRRRMRWRERLAPCATSSGRLPLPALTIWRYFTHADFLRDDGRSVNPAPTVMLNGFLILAAIFATALPVITKMQRRRSSEHELETGSGQNETPIPARRTSLGASEQVNLLHDQSKETMSVRRSHREWPPRRSPPPTSLLPQLPQQSPMTPPPSPLLPPRPPPSRLPPSRLPQQPSLSSWASNSTLQGCRDGCDAYAATLPPCACSFIARQ